MPDGVRGKFITLHVFIVIVIILYFHFVFIMFVILICYVIQKTFGMNRLSGLIGRS